MGGPREPEGGPRPRWRVQRPDASDGAPSGAPGSSWLASWTRSNSRYQESRSRSRGRLFGFCRWASATALEGPPGVRICRAPRGARQILTPGGPSRAVAEAQRQNPKSRPRERDRLSWYLLLLLVQLASQLDPGAPEGAPSLASGRCTRHLGRGPPSGSLGPPTGDSRSKGRDVPLQRLAGRRFLPVAEATCHPHRIRYVF